MHAVLPGSDANVPPAHAVHTVAPGVDEYPGAHGTGADTPLEGQYDPAGHALHDDEPIAAYVPAPHGTQADRLELPFNPFAVPPGQLMMPPVTTHTCVMPTVG